jgi:unsaturated rhamnogalacturonyl hydrolase
MFAYAILVAVENDLLSKDEYLPVVERAYNGLRQHSINDLGNGHLTVKNVCKGTCIGDMQYYLDRKAESEKPSGIGMFLLFGRAYELYQLKKDNN